MYLPEADVIQLFKRIANSFSKSQIVFEAGASFVYGIKRATDVESYANNIKIIEEWSYFDDPDVRPRFQHMLRNVKSFSRTLWTIQASIL